MEELVLKVEHLTKVYQSGSRTLPVLTDVSFGLQAGATLSVVGPSGSGKTTLLGLCAGLDRPTSGEVFLGGHRLNELDEEKLAHLRRRAVGFVFQTFQLIPTLTALENVMVPAELLGEDSAREQADMLLTRVGMGERLDHYPGQLSGGEQQRTALARAFINRPRVLFADEPTGNLDGETADTVQTLLFDLNREQGTALVLVTHNLDLATRTERILRLRSGRLVENRLQKAVREAQASES